MMMAIYCICRSRTSTKTSYYRDGDYRSEFASKYNYYDANKHLPDYLYNSSSDLLGTWKHYNLSNQTMVERNTRANARCHGRHLIPLIMKRVPTKTSKIE